MQHCYFEISCVKIIQVQRALPGLGSALWLDFTNRLSFQQTFVGEEKLHDEQKEHLQGRLWLSLCICKFSAFTFVPVNQSYRQYSTQMKFIAKLDDFAIFGGIFSLFSSRPCRKPLAYFECKWHTRRYLTIKQIVNGHLPSDLFSLYTIFCMKKGTITFNNTLTILISHYCIFTKALTHLIHCCFWLLSSLPQSQFLPTVVNLRKSLLIKTRFYRMQMIK